MKDLARIADEIIGLVGDKLEKQYEAMKREEIYVDFPHVLWAYPIARDARDYNEFVSTLRETIINILSSTPRSPSTGRIRLRWSSSRCSCNFTPTAPFIDLISEGGTIRHFSSGICPLGVIANYTLKNLSGTVVLASKRISIQGFSNIMPEKVNGSILLPEDSGKPPPIREIYRILIESGITMFYISPGGRYKTELLYEESTYLPL